MEDKEYLDKFEATVYKTIHDFLLAKGEIDEIDPDAPDIEGKWEGIAQSYLADGVREFNNYPTVSLGWMMFVGMALAKFYSTKSRLIKRQNLCVRQRLFINCIASEQQSASMLWTPCAVSP